MEAERHTIRLRGPWEFRLLADTHHAGMQHGKIDISQAAELLQHVVGRIEWIRRFHRPTGLEGGERVHLIVGSCVAAVAVDLNDGPLVAAGTEMRYDITDHLELRNVLRVVVDVDSTQPVQLEDVRLEITQA